VSGQASPRAFSVIAFTSSLYRGRGMTFFVLALPLPFGVGEDFAVVLAIPGLPSVKGVNGYDHHAPVTAAARQRLPDKLQQWKGMQLGNAADGCVPARSCRARASG
jgi:hypothetical protein